MTSHSSVIVNHRVALPGTSTHSAIATHRLDYVRSRLGSVREPTGDDIRREELKRRGDALGYISHRRGSVIDENANCALFDASGIADYGIVKRELMSAEGAILTSVVTVRREDAEELGLQTKQDFERFLRAHWAEHLEQMGIMQPQDVRWVAALHTNSKANYHAHVLSWDESGRFNDLIPKARLEQARQALVSKALAPARQAANRERTQARDELAASMRDSVLSEEQLCTLRDIAGSLPERGSLKYGNLARRDPALKQRIDALVRDRISSSPEMSVRLEAFERAVEHHADLKGLEGTAREAHRVAAMDDLSARLGNAQLKQAREAAGIAEPPRQRDRPKPVLPEGDRVVLPAERKRETAISQELSSCLKKGEKEELAKALSAGIEPPAHVVKKVADLPAVRQYAKLEGASLQGLRGLIANGVARLGTALGRLAEQAANSGGRDHGDEMGRQVLRWGARVMGAMSSLLLKAIRTPDVPNLKAPVQNLKESIRIKR